MLLHLWFSDNEFMIRVPLRFSIPPVSSWTSCRPGINYYYIIIKSHFSISAGNDTLWYSL